MNTPDRHPHFCECDTCLNPSGGTRLDGAGYTRFARSTAYLRRKIAERSTRRRLNRIRIAR